MLRPMMTAPAALIWSTSARFSSPSNIRACNRSPQPSPPSSPNGLSSVWCGPAAYPSAVTVWLTITVPPCRDIRSPPAVMDGQSVTCALLWIRCRARSTSPSIVTAIDETGGHQRAVHRASSTPPSPGGSASAIMALLPAAVAGTHRPTVNFRRAAFAAREIAAKVDRAVRENALRAVRARPDSSQCHLTKADVVVDPGRCCVVTAWAGTGTRVKGANVPASPTAEGARVQVRTGTRSR
jgi:hypothetical protein